jgi:hypothetical protein
MPYDGTLFVVFCSGLSAIYRVSKTQEISILSCVLRVHSRTVKVHCRSLHSNKELYRSDHTNQDNGIGIVRSTMTIKQINSTNAHTVIAETNLFIFLTPDSFNKSNNHV